MADRSDRPKRVLVTGAAGRFGQRLVAHLTELGIATTGLVLSTSDEPGTDRTVVGDAREPAVVAEALSDVDAVMHLAAIPAPNLAEAHEVFGLNTLATFAVLDEAARAGVRRAVIASSFSATGLPFAPVPVRPDYLPVDEDLPPLAADPYALSKQTDELTAAMMWRRYGLSVVALRFPFLGEPERRLAERANRDAEHPEAGIRDLWSYLDDRDAARACVAGLTEAPPGCHVIGLAAPVTLSPYPTEALLNLYLPDVPRRCEFPGRLSPVDTSQARTLLRFEAEHIYPVREMSLG
jgi:nucleoside-diphosphate-sugar epimerase